MTKSRTIIRTLATALALASSTAAVAAPGQRAVFVSCPILRNTALPCWMGKDGDELYYLGPQTDLASDFYPPQFRHKMLVEAEIADGPRICGGVPLKNVTASVLPDIDDSCNVMLPAEGYPDPPNHRGTGPSGVRGGEPPPARPLYAPQPVADVPAQPWPVREFVAPFNAASDRKWRPAGDAASKAASYARAVNAKQIEIIGYRAAIRLSNGTDYVEAPRVAEDRARVIEEALQQVGVPKTTKLVVTWQAAPVPSTGTAKDAAARRTVIKVTPGAAPSKTADKTAAAPVGG